MSAQEETDLRPLIIHVAESFAGGVAAAIADYVASTPDCEHKLIFAERQDAPLDRTALGGFTEVTPMAKGHLARLAQIRLAARGAHPVIVHAHSSFAGVYARVALRRRQGLKVVYTPHCFAFERRDLSKLFRAAFWLAEWVLARNTSAFACCSPREAKLARLLGASAEVVFVPNVFRPPLSLPRHSGSIAGDLIVGFGRVGAQKDPWYFADAVNSLREAGRAVRAIWIGGSAESGAELPGIEMLGWRDRLEILTILAGADLYLHSAKWEGFPIALLEVASVGVPAVVRAVPSMTGMTFPATIDDPAELLEVWDRLAEPAYREGLVEGLRSALSQNTPAGQAGALRHVYGLNAGE